MPFFTILFGIALIMVGVGTYIGAGQEASIQSFLLQMILGLLSIGLGVGSTVKKEMRMHLMHGAVLLAAMGVIVPAFSFAAYLLKLEQDVQMELLRVLLTVAFSAIYVYMAVRSFRSARKNRTNQSADASSGLESGPLTTRSE